MNNIYEDIAKRTQGDIYIGVVGPVRTGKSTFIKRFMEIAVVPNIQDEYLKGRTIDELPQSGEGKTIMTTEPKFIPSSAATVQIDEEVNVKIRLVDCVGYVIPSSKGYNFVFSPNLSNITSINDLSIISVTFSFLPLNIPNKVFL